METGGATTTSLLVVTSRYSFSFIGDHLYGGAAGQLTQTRGSHPFPWLQSLDNLNQSILALANRDLSLLHDSVLDHERLGDPHEVVDRFLRDKGNAAVNPDLEPRFTEGARFQQPVVVGYPGLDRKGPGIGEDGRTDPIH